MENTIRAAELHSVITTLWRLAASNERYDISTKQIVWTMENMRNRAGTADQKQLLDNLITYANSLYEVGDKEEWWRGADTQPQ